ncbi:lactate utilization protein C [Nocardioides sp. MAH-18]|uniref:Lactate utilization protein C n=1 Tax=Nocardioides agri TaxID=2682843 RepID=A0A6L6XSJ4_9ACTN|nr:MULTISPECIES: lactate utilization protein C [unclassified Nocardioides]MBA2955328.1 lactate utilization protein C [Nocardioides sp. CGMCC 1.13656]MVQ50179.1 lactate utilization protein C [Nocardioides sp. MAH-18]
MSARDDILGRVRAALAGVESGYDVPVAPRIADVPDLVDLFAERVADYQATVERCTGSDLAARVAAALPSGARVVVPDGLSVEVPGGVRDRGFTAAELDTFDAVVTEARVGIAETGTIVLDHGAGQGRRAISLVPDLHVCIVRTDQVVPDVPDALPLLAPGATEGRPLTWISGPSATSDIELSRVEGVHGPRTLHVLVVG